jgi:ribosomal subunit interface protein
MKINVSGHHCDITESINEDIQKKFSKIENHFSSIVAIDVFVAKEHNEHTVEVATKYEGASISVKGKNKIMYPAISQAVKKLNAALEHRKGQLKGDLHDKPTVTTPEIAHEIIQGLDLN